MAYTPDIFQQQLQDLSRQYQQLQQTPQFTQPMGTMPMQYPQAPVISHQVQYVEGMTGAIKYQLEKLPSNSSEVIMDKDDNIFYLVSKDANGTPAKKIPVGRFSIEEVQEEPPNLTRKDFEDFKEEIRQLLATKQTPTQTQPVKRTTTTTTTGDSK